MISTLGAVPPGAPGLQTTALVALILVAVVVRATRDGHLLLSVATGDARPDPGAGMPSAITVVPARRGKLRGKAKAAKPAPPPPPPMLPPDDEDPDWDVPTRSSVPAQAAAPVETAAPETVLPVEGGEPDNEVRPQFAWPADAYPTPAARVDADDVTAEDDVPVDDLPVDDVPVVDVRTVTPTEAWNDPVAEPVAEPTWAEPVAEPVAERVAPIGQPTVASVAADLEDDVVDPAEAEPVAEGRHRRRGWLGRRRRHEKRAVQAGSPAPDPAPVDEDHEPAASTDALDAALEVDWNTEEIPVVVDEVHDSPSVVPQQQVVTGDPVIVHVPETQAVAPSSEQSAALRVGERYGVDWSEVDGDGWDDGWVAARGEWWASRRDDVSVEFHGDVHVMEQAAGAGDQPGGDADPESVLEWWERLAEDDLHVVTAADVAEPVEQVEALEPPHADEAWTPEVASVEPAFVAEPVAELVAEPIAEPVLEPVEQIDYVVADPSTPLAWLQDEPEYEPEPEMAYEPEVLPEPVVETLSVVEAPVVEAIQVVEDEIVEDEDEDEDVEDETPVDEVTHESNPETAPEPVVVSVQPEDDVAAIVAGILASVGVPLEASGKVAVPPVKSKRAPAVEPGDRKVPVPRNPDQPTAAQRDALRNASKRISRATNRIGVAEMTAREAASLVEADMAALVVRSVEGPRVLWLYPNGGETEIWGPQTLAALLAVGGAVREVLSGDPLAGGYPTAVLSVPVASAGALVGTVVARRNSPRAFTKQEENVLDRLARMTGAALDALTRRGALAAEGDVDEETHYATRERMLTDVRSALRTRVDHDMQVMLVIGELDGLARISSELGKDLAREVLTTMTAAIASSLRIGDVPYRLGEDRFAVLLPATGLEDARAVAMRLVTLVETTARRDFATAGPLRLRSAVLTVEGSAEDVVTAADHALSVDHRR